MRVRHADTEVTETGERYAEVEPGAFGLQAVLRDLDVAGIVVEVGIATLKLEIRRHVIAERTRQWLPQLRVQVDQIAADGPVHSTFEP